MGIPGLPEFVNNHFTKWLCVNHKEWNCLIVDGSNVCCKLYTRNYKWYLGGEYKAYTVYVEGFFEELRTHFKNPVVVVDGGKFGCGDKKQKNRTSKWVRDKPQHSNRILILVFMDVLRKMGIKVFVVQSDADHVIAGLAKHHNCPVLSSDSDFFMYELNAGVIQIDHWLRDRIGAQMFNLQRFMEQYSLKEYEQCLIIPAKRGNDVIKSDCQEWSWTDLLKLCQCSWKEFQNDDNFKRAKQFYSKFSLPPSMEHASSDTTNTRSTGRATATTDNIATVTAEADTAVRNLTTATGLSATDTNTVAEISTTTAETDHTEADHTATAEADPTATAEADPTATAETDPTATAETDPAFTHPLPAWMFSEFEEGRLPTFLIKVCRVKFCRLPKIVQDTRNESAWIISRRIRQYLYGLLGLQSTINEIAGEECTIRPKFLKTPLTVTHQLFASKDRTPQQQDLVLTILQCHKIPKNEIENIFNCLAKEWKLPLAATFFWYRNLPKGHQRRDLLVSLLLSFLACSDLIPMPSPSPRQPHAVNKTLHAFAQWQCVYYDARALNYLAREPFHTTSFASLYSGEVAMHYATIVPRQKDWLACVIDIKNLCSRKLINDFLYLITGRDESGREQSSWTRVASKS